MGKATPFLWFNGNAEEAINFYVSLFDDGKILSIQRYGDEVPGMQGKVMLATFRIAGLELMAIDGGPQYAFTPATSIFVSCDTQEEIDRLWEKLSEGGTEMQCGWLTDRYGLTWQIVPSRLGELMRSGEPAQVQRVVQAMLQMVKFDIAALERAYEGQ